jgi:tetrapyrrole methylase family protein/MazG family protein
MTTSQDQQSSVPSGDDVRFDTVLAGQSLDAFAQTIATLRGPDGCPWDLEQTHRSIARNMIEEAYETLEALENNDIDALREELGDVLLQVVFQSQIAAEAKEFTLKDVIDDVNAKLIRRHPHVFGNEAAFKAAGLSEAEVAQVLEAQTADKVLDLWDQIKLREKTQKAQKAQRAHLAQKGEQAGLLSSVPRAMPALMQAQDISRKAVSAGFEWDTIQEVWDKVFEEVEEFKAATPNTVHACEEFGDVLFTLVNVARKCGIDAESALRACCDKFRERWAFMEQCAVKQGVTVSSVDNAQREAWWQQAKG